jgi:acetoin utilization protein AcuB
LEFPSVFAEEERMTVHALSEQPIEALMTWLPTTVTADTDVRAASALMAELRVHHLPVVQGGELIGVVSARDLDIAATMRSANFPRMAVAEVLVGDPTIADAAEPLTKVVARMTDSADDCCVITRENVVIGIVTHDDVVRAFLRLLGTESSLPQPEAIRARILREHERIRSLLDHMEVLAGRLASGERSTGVRLRNWARELSSVLRAHLDLEEELLLPAIRQVDAFGDARADELLAEHAVQRQLLGRVVDELCTAPSDAALAVGVLELVRALRDDIVAEERDFLGEVLLRDSLVPVDSFGG